MSISQIHAKIEQEQWLTEWLKRQGNDRTFHSVSRGILLVDVILGTSLVLQIGEIFWFQCVFINSNDLKWFLFLSAWYGSGDESANKDESKCLKSLIAVVRPVEEKAKAFGLLFSHYCQFLALQLPSGENTIGPLDRLEIDRVPLGYCIKRALPCNFQIPLGNLSKTT